MNLTSLSNNYFLLDLKNFSCFIYMLIAFFPSSEYSVNKFPKLPS